MKHFNEFNEYINEFLVNGHTTKIHELEFIDLGLPSGTKWANCNFGASSPEQNGTYFMWGSTEDNSNTICDWEYAPFNNGSLTFNKDYFDKQYDHIVFHNKLINDYDPAYQYSNGAYSMPTLRNVLELKKYCVAKNCSDYNNTGVAGVIVSSKINGNEIFIPFSGRRRDDKFEQVGSFAELGALDYVKVKCRVTLRATIYGNIRENSAFLYDAIPIRPIQK